MAMAKARVQDLVEMLSEQHERFYLGDSSLIVDMNDAGDYEDSDQYDQACAQARKLQADFYGMSVIAFENY